MRVAVLSLEGQEVANFGAEPSWIGGGDRCDAHSKVALVEDPAPSRGDAVLVFSRVLTELPFPLSRMPLWLITPGLVGGTNWARAWI